MHKISNKNISFTPSPKNTKTMNKLEQLYAESQAFLKWGREVPAELQEQITKLEKAAISNQVLSLFEDIAPREIDLNGVSCDILIALEYSDGKLIRLGCCDSPEPFFSDTTVSVLPVTEDEADDEEDSPDDDPGDEEGNKRAKSIKFTVKFADGKSIYYRNSLRTMIEALKYMGLERASKYTGEDFMGFPLVGKRQRITDDGYKWQQYVDGWWIYRNLSNSRKVRCLKGVSKLLNVPLEIVYDEDVPEMKRASKSKGKRTMYSLNDLAPLPKNRAVLEAVRLFIQQFPDASFAEVAEMFPASLQGSYGVVRTIRDIEKRSSNNRTESDRWFLDPREILTAHDGVRFAVSSEWGDNFDGFQKHIQDSFGWKVEEV